MRARNIKPGLFRNEELGKLGSDYIVLFEGLWCSADREGKLEDRPLRLKADIFPYRDSPIDISDMLDRLQNSQEKFILRYEVNGNRYIKILNFLEHQRPHNNESPSTIPEPPVNQGRKPFRPRKKALRPDSLIPDSLIPDSLIPDSLIPDSNVPSEIGMGLASFLFELIKKRNNGHKPPNLKKWAVHVDKMIRIDKRDPGEIERVIEWCQTDIAFWANNILSTEKLREHYDQLKLKMNTPAKEKKPDPPKLKCHREWVPPE